MSYLSSYHTHCPHCGWRGRVGFGDVRAGPFTTRDGALFHIELICPQCKHQVKNPRTEERERPTHVLSPEQEAQWKANKQSEPTTAMLAMPERAKCSRCSWKGALPETGEAYFYFCPWCWTLLAPALDSSEPELIEWVASIQREGQKWRRRQWASLPIGLAGLATLPKNSMLGAAISITAAGVSLALQAASRSTYRPTLREYGGEWADGTGRPIARRQP